MTVHGLSKLRLDDLQIACDLVGTSRRLGSPVLAGSECWRAEGQSWRILGHLVTLQTRDSQETVHLQTLRTLGRRSIYTN
jgi:hypothetical protein